MRPNAKALAVAIGLCALAHAVRAPASDAVESYSERLARVHCAGSHENAWSKLIEERKLAELTMMARGMKFSEAADFWCAVRAMPSAQFMWPNVEGFYRTSSRGDFIATTMASYIWNNLTPEPYAKSDDDTLEVLAQAIIQVNEGAISGCALSEVVEQGAIDVLRDLGTMLGERRKALAQLQCHGKTLIELAVLEGRSSEFGEILVAGQPEYTPPAQALLAAAQSGSMQMLTFLLRFEYAEHDLRNALELARQLPEPIRSRAIALISTALSADRSAG